MAPPSITYLSKYLLDFKYTCSAPDPFVCACRLIPWKGSTCLAILCYVRKQLPDSDYNMNMMINEILWYLNDAAREHERISEVSRYSRELTEIADEISQIITNSFIQEVRRFFKVPKLQHVRDVDKNLKPNEILASFMAFLVEIVNCESLKYERILDFEPYSHLHKELTFLLTIIGDSPFECTELVEVNNLLTEFETFADEAGSYIYSFLCKTNLEDSRFIENGNALSQKLKLLHAMIRDHFIKFSDFSGRYLTSETNYVDSLFNIDSLLEDMENFTSDGVTFVTNKANAVADVGRCQMGDGTHYQILEPPPTADDCTYHMKKLYSELMMSRTLLKNIGHPQHEGTYELKEYVVQIRGAAYVSEYLINSLSAKKLPIWYVLLRLPGITQTIQLLF